MAITTVAETRRHRKHAPWSRAALSRASARDIKNAAGRLHCPQTSVIRRPANVS
jgi:hypothetical protein